MKRQKSTNYTIWIARTGRNPIVLSLCPPVVIFAVSLPAVLIGAVFLSFVYENTRLSQRNLRLTEEAAGIVQQVEALESSISSLQERASQSDATADETDRSDPAFLEDLFGEQDANENLDEEGLEEDALDDRDLDPNRWNSDELDGREVEPEAANPDDRELNTAATDTADRDVAERDANDSKPHRISQRLGMTGVQAGVGGAEAEELLELAKAKLPHLLNELEGEVEPALEAVFVRQDAKPKGVPLTSSDTEISSAFGLRANPFGWGYEFHQGMDFVAAYGAPVHVTAPGIVSKAEWEPGFGNHVIVDHGYGYETLYAHLSQIKTKPGDRVDRQQIIGYLGNTGRSSGPHLHYSVFLNEQVVDPKKYLD
jgi:murein DD-endopeptidase MepM/ murein hydrolase activator NlpD